MGCAQLLLWTQRRDAAMLATRTNVPTIVGAIALCLILLPVRSAAVDVDQNTTGLPTYPHLRRAIMDAVSRNTLGHQCTHFAADSADPLEAVEAWYRKALPGAVESDVNQDSIYGSYFKLTGIKLTKGSDFLTVYRTDSGTSTSIELFKCREASK
jgi:hypothetical protein